jgi:hypothetical protein
MPSALLVAHPAHELRLHGWLARVRPEVHVLTTGSRSGEGRERIEATGRLIDALGCPRGRVFGPFVDRDLYRGLMSGDSGPFHALADDLRDALVSRRAARLVVDGWQFYSAAHDLAHLIGRAAAAEASATLGRPVEVLEFAVTPEPHTTRPDTWRARLGEAAIAAKRAAALAHPGIEAETAEVLAGAGPDALAVEALRAPPALADLPPAPGQRPLYEAFGEARVKAGLYGEVLRWAHMAPVYEAFAARIETARAVELRRAV